MYAPTYGYSPSPGNPNPASQFLPNGAAPPLQQQHQQQQQQPQHPHQQQQQQQQQPGQQPQHMMYNTPQQYPMGGLHQSPYGASAPNMGGNAGGMGMMQNNGMAHMGGPHVPTYQTPYTGSPYGASIPTSSAPNMMPNFMPATTSSQSFPMNAPNMNMTPQQQQQHQAQRMQPPPNASTPTPGGMASPFGGMPLNTPPGPSSTPSQLSTPQNPNKTLLQTPNNQQSQGGGHGGTILTPQTPNFPPGAQGANSGNSIASPLSPGSQTREKERVSLLLDINTELLKEVMHLQVLQGETKKEESPDVAAADKEKAEKLKASITKEYVECMRRLQSNLAYLAAIADRSHKPSSQIPPHPAIMFAPPLIPKSTKPTTLSSPKTEKQEEADEKKTEQSGQERIELLKDYYKQLQALFPGVDPAKEPPMPQPNPAARTQAQQQQMAQQQKQQQGQGGDQSQQQKIQNDLLRQKMMQQAQQQALNQQQMAQGMQGMNPQQTQNR